MEVFFEVFSSRQHGEREGENVTEAQFAVATLGPLRAAKAASGDGASRDCRSAGQSPAQPEGA